METVSFAQRVVDRNRNKPRQLPANYTPEMHEEADRVIASDQIAGKLLSVGVLKPLTESKRNKLRYAVWHAREHWRLKLGLPA